MRIAATISFLIFSIVLFIGTNNIVIILANLSIGIKSEIVNSKLKSSLNSIMEEEKSEKGEDIPDGKVIDIICDHFSQLHFFNLKLKAEYVATNEIVASVHEIPIFIPPPNILKA